MINRLIFGIIFMVLNLIVVSAQAQEKSLKKIEQISVKATFSGDIKGQYDFSGPVGSLITATASTEDSVCEISSLFRKVKYQGQKTVQAWLILDCLFKGQKYQYKLHRIHLNLTEPIQKVRLPMLSENLKNIQIVFEDLSLKLGKK